MHLKSIAVSTAFCVLVFAGAAQAEDVTAQKPGVMCVSSAALARLTLADGDSRTHRPGASGADSAAARQGGCVDIVLGSKATVLQRRRNTSIVSFPAEAPNSTIYIVPNIDFSQPGATATASASPEDLPAVRPANQYADANAAPSNHTSPDQLFDGPHIDAIVASLAYDKMSGIIPDYHAYAIISKEYQNANVFQQQQVLSTIEAGYQTQFNALTLAQTYAMNINAALDQYDASKGGYALNFNDQTDIIFADPLNLGNSYNLVFDNADSYNLIPFANADEAEDFANKFNLNTHYQTVNSVTLQIAYRLVSVPPAIGSQYDNIDAHILAARVLDYTGQIMFQFAQDPALTVPPASSGNMASGIPALKSAAVQQISIGMTQQSAVAAAEKLYAGAKRDAGPDHDAFFADFVLSGSYTCDGIGPAVDQSTEDMLMGAQSKFSKCLAFNFSNGKVTKVVSQQTLSSVTQAAVLQALTAKYGTPSYTGSNLGLYEDTWIGSDPTGNDIDIDAEITSQANQLVLTVTATPWKNPRAVAPAPPPTAPSGPQL